MARSVIKIISALLMLSTVKSEGRGSHVKLLVKFPNSKYILAKETHFHSAADINSQTLFIAYINDFQVALPCGTGTVLENGNITWMKDNRIIVTRNVIDKTMLIVQRLKVDDCGIYHCKFCNGFKCYNGSSMNLIVVAEKLLGNQSVIAGSDAFSSCSNFNNSQYEAILFKSNMEILSQQRNNTLKKVSKQDEGWYTCEISDRTDGTLIFRENAFLNVLASNRKSSNVTTILITIVVILVIAMMVLLGIMWFQKKPRREYDEHNIKMVTVSKKTSADGILKPVVRVRRQSIMVLRNKKNPAKVFKYKFPLDMEWEFPREKLVLGKMLGIGAFGKVFLATTDEFIEEGTTSVAVRMLSAEHSDEDVEDLVHELEVMKMVGTHPNIVNLLGCCSKDGPLYVIVDYAAHGDLQSFLRSHRFESDLSQKTKQVICSNQLFSYVSQIASGMEYLTSVGCIHQDLKARNVLVCDNHTVKITDYGRDIYSLDRFPKTSSGKVSIQWMAPESLQEHTFNAKSDVWSFGVLFWEVMSLGEVPFADVEDCTKLMELLKQEKRLDKPSNCPDGAYSIMMDCWQFTPSSRPTFSEIIQQIPYTVLLVNEYSQVHDENENVRDSYACVYETMNSNE